MSEENNSANEEKSDDEKSNDVQTTIIISAEMHQQLRLASFNSGRSMSAIIRDALKPVLKGVGE